MRPHQRLALGAQNTPRLRHLVEPITAWHADWQSMFPADCCEIPIGNHRADVRSPDGLVIEFQHSALSVDEIREREDHYGSMLWVFDAVEAFQTDRLNLRCKAPHCNSRTYGVWGSYRTYTYAPDPPQHKCYRNDDISDDSLCCPLSAQECLTRRFGPPPIGEMLVHQRQGAQRSRWMGRPARG